MEIRWRERREKYEGRKNGRLDGEREREMGRGKGRKREAGERKMGRLDGERARCVWGGGERGGREKSGEIRWRERER